MTRTSFGDQIQQMWHTRPVRLPRQGPVAGVAAGFGLRYGVDPVLLRVAFVVSTIFGGAGIVLYLLAWLVLSSAGNEVSAAEALSDHARGAHSQTKTIVLIVALAIAVSTMGPIGLGMGGSGVLSMGLMLAGWWMLYLRHPELPVGFDAYRAAPPPGYPTAGYPTGAPLGGYLFRPEVATSMYTPYTKLPDTYTPDPATTVRDEPRTDTAESTPLLRVDHTETVVLHKDTVSTPQDAASATSDTASTSSTSAGVSPGAATDQPDTDHTSAASASGLPSTAPDPARPSVTDPTGTRTDAPHRAPDQDELAASASAASGADSLTAQSAAIGETTDLRGDAPVDLGKADASRTPDPAGEQEPGSDAPTTVLRKDPAPGPRLAAQVPQGWDPLAVAPLAWELPEPAPRGYAPVAPPPPAPKRPRSRLTPITIGLAILAAALAGAVAASGAEWMTPARIAAVALAVVGLGLVAGAFLRRGYGLLVLTAPLAGFVLLASLIGPIDFDERAVGDRVWAPTSVNELQPRYALDIGSGTLDLRGLELTEPRSVEVAVNIGDAKVQLPEDMTVRTTCAVRVSGSSCVEGVTGPNTPGAPILDLHIKMHLGDVEVTRG
ncbi:PspC domain-containing protein [Nocardia sp. SSK8]|uniref:PspC domain-containing protein n=1 Tax=Nocardia sp. SSK8 TaxID=3120154 RepID=UPI00300BBD9C